MATRIMVLNGFNLLADQLSKINGATSSYPNAAEWVCKDQTGTLAIGPYIGGGQCVFVEVPIMQGFNITINGSTVIEAKELVSVDISGCDVPAMIRLWWPRPKPVTK